MNLRLVKLTKEYQPQLNEMMEEWLSLEKHFSPYAIRKNDYHNFEYYLENLEVKEPVDFLVPDSTFFCLDTERNIFVGAVNIRHYLSENNCKLGGHIGDGVRPSERRKGVATAMIGLALEECKKLGINKVLMTCDADNIGSEKSIRNNGGVFESIVEEEGEQEKRFWITLHEETVETERVLLRREMPSDYKDCSVWTMDNRVYKYLISPAALKSPEEMLPYLYRQDPNSKNRILMIAHRKEDGHTIGCIGMFYDEAKDIWSFGYTLQYNDWNKGYATEITRGMIDYLKQKYGAKTIEAECAKENTGSIRVMEKLGMKRVGESTYSKKDNSATFDSWIYRMEL